MKSWTTALRFWPVLVLGSLVAAEVFWLRVEYRKAGHVRQRWGQQLSREKQLADLAPGLTRENEQAMAAELAQWQRTLANRRKELWQESERPAVAQGGSEPVDAYFDLAATAERLRAMAAAAGVVVKPDEYFGFETYAREGPIFPSAEKVREQSRVGEMVLGCLFQAKPERLLGVKRERVEPSAVGGNHQVTDYFALAPGLSLRRPDEIETVALRLEFRGETPVLRDFLNALARAPELLVVRSVEVTTPEQKAAGNAGRSGDSTGFVAGPKPSQFAVIVEAVKPAAGPVSVQP